MAVTAGSDVGARLVDEELTRRALRHVLSGSTDMAPDVLRVPLRYYRDPEVLRREREEILELTPLALVPTAQVPDRHDFVVREVLGRSVLISRGDDGVARAFLNYCRHQGATRTALSTSRIAWAELPTSPPGVRGVVPKE
jgi:hypothetical protein